MNTDDKWLRAFREWSCSDAAPLFPSCQEVQEAEWAFKAGWDAREKLVEELRALIEPETL